MTDTVNTIFLIDSYGSEGSHGTLNFDHVL